jgi:hypothetical protein
MHPTIKNTERKREGERGGERGREGERGGERGRKGGRGGERGRNGGEKMGVGEKEWNQWGGRGTNKVGVFCHLTLM